LRFRVGLIKIKIEWKVVGDRLIDGFVRLGVVIIEDDISVGWADSSDILLLDDIFRFVVERDVADSFEDATDDR
jgi:hypothetical protein